MKKKFIENKGFKMKKNLLKTKINVKNFLERCNCGEIALWTSGCSPYKWCDKHVPRGCSCNNEYLITEEEREDFISFQKKQLEKDTNNRNGFDLIFVDKNRNKSFAEGKEINLSVSKWCIASNRKYNINYLDLMSELKLPLKVVPVDKKGREFPCCEILDLEEFIKEDIRIFNIIKVKKIKNKNK